MGQTQTKYFADRWPSEIEDPRLVALEELCDATTAQRLTALGIESGWSCLEVAAGRGSITRLMADRVGRSGRVVATDLNPRFLRRNSNDLPANVEVRQHDIVERDVEPRAYDLVHARALLVHLRDPERALQRMATALRRGGWLLVEEADFSMFRASDPHHPAAEAFDLAVRAVLDATRAQGVWDGYLGHRTPLMVARLGLEQTGHDCVPFMTRGGDGVGGRFWNPTFRLSGPSLVDSGAVSQADLDCVLKCMRDPEFHFVGGVLFGAWGRAGG